MPNLGAYILKKLLVYYNISRLRAYTGYLLVFFPSAFGICLACGGNTEGKADLDLKDFKSLGFFFAASIIVRSAGCIINDIFDRKLDSMVFRTRNRPLAIKSISVVEATGLFILLSLAALLFLFQLNTSAVWIGLVAGLLIVIYPLMKRITYFPQLFLGLVFNLGAMISYTDMTGEIFRLQSLLLYLGCCSWTVGYDTVYAFMDLVDDKKIGIKSTAVLFESKNYRFWILLCYFAFIFCFILSFVLSGIKCNQYLVFVSCSVLLWQVYDLNIKDMHNCLNKFKSNNYVAIFLFLSTFV
jgi:4-hydroxybenzoate polyprenyltransferase